MKDPFFLEKALKFAIDTKDFKAITFFLAKNFSLALEESIKERIVESLINVEIIAYKENAGKSLLRNIISKKKSEIAQLIINSDKFNQSTYNDEEKYSILIMCLDVGDHNVARALITKGFNPLNRNNQNSSFFEKCLFNPDDKSFEFIETSAKASNLDTELTNSSSQEETLTARERLALSQDKYQEANRINEFNQLINQDNQFDEQSKADFIKYAKSKFILNFSYAKNNCRSNKRLVRKICQSLLQENTEDRFEKKDEILTILKAIEEESKIDGLKGVIYHVNVVKLINHAAYFISEENSAKQITKLSYVEPNGSKGSDGNNYGVFSFDVEANKLEDISNFINKDFKLGFGKKQILEELTKTLGDPEYSIPMQPQKRGNCVFKSQNLLIRELLRRMDPEMQFQKNKETGKIEGRGYQVYKEYKKRLTTDLIANMEGFANSQNPLIKKGAAAVLIKICEKMNIKQAKQEIIKCKTKEKRPKLEDEGNNLTSTLDTQAEFTKKLPTKEVLVSVKSSEVESQNTTNIDDINPTNKPNQEQINLNSDIISEGTKSNRVTERIKFFEELDEKNKIPSTSVNKAKGSNLSNSSNSTRLI